MSNKEERNIDEILRQGATELLGLDDEVENQPSLLFISPLQPYLTLHESAPSFVVTNTPLFPSHLEYVTLLSYLTPH